MRSPLAASSQRGVRSTLPTAVRRTRCDHTQRLPELFAAHAGVDILSEPVSPFGPQAIAAT